MRFSSLFRYLARRLTNPHNLTRVHLRREIARFDYAVGDHTYGRPLIRSWGEGARLTIGRYCSIADNVRIFLGGNHRTDWVSTFPFSDLPDAWPEARDLPSTVWSPGDVTIGSDVWIGSSVTVLAGTTIGHGAVIGAAAVVSQDIPDYAIVAGNPARVIKSRFDDDTIARLVETGWWNLPRPVVVKLLPLLLSDRINDFVDACTALGNGARS